MEELKKAGTRDFTTGFLFGNPQGEAQDVKNINHNEYIFAAKVLGYDDKNKLIKIEQRNKFEKGDTLEILSPEIKGSFKVDKIIDEDGAERESAPHPQQVLYINCNIPLKNGDMLRKKLI